MKVKKKMGRPLLGDKPMEVFPIRLEKAQIEAFRAYAAKTGLGGPGTALRELALAGLAAAGYPLRGARNGRTYP